MRSVVITGASTGIGEAAAKVLIGEGFRVFGSVRKREDGERLKAELGPNFVPLQFDVTDEAAVQAAAKQVRAALNGETLAGLVNNAGIAVPGPILELPLAEWRRQFETNVFGQVIASQAFAPLLGTDLSLKGEPGRIVMISSVGGKRALPFAGPYSATKHALEGLSEALRRELMMFGIDVIVIGPGPIKTAIWGKSGNRDLDRFGNTPYAKPMEGMRKAMSAVARNGLPAEDVGRLIHKVLTEKNPRVRYAIMPRNLQRTVMSWLPKRVQDRMVARWIGLERVRP